MIRSLFLPLGMFLCLAAAQAATVFTGDTIQGVPVISQLIGASPPGLRNITRTWMINDLGGAQINPNRTWPGHEDGNTVERHSWLITNQLIKGNVDAAIDHHAGGTGTDFAKFIFVYGDSAEAITPAQLLPVDQIMLDPGYPGTLEYLLVKADIPAMTTELGGARKFVPEMVRVAIIGSDAASERGSEILTLLVNRADCGAKACKYKDKGEPRE